MYKYSVRDRKEGHSCGTIDTEGGVNQYWRFMLLRNDEVMALFRFEKEANSVAEALNRNFAMTGI